MRILQPNAESGRRKTVNLRLRDGGKVGLTSYLRSPAVSFRKSSKLAASSSSISRRFVPCLEHSWPVVQIGFPLAIRTDSIFLAQPIPGTGKAQYTV